MILRFFLCAVIWFFSSFALAMATPRSEIQYLVKHYKLSDAKISINAKNNNDGRSIYEYAQYRQLVPGSVNKLLVAAAALFVLPSNFRFTTTIYYNKKNVNNGVLSDNLYIEFTGDPTLLGTELYNLIAQINKKGIRYISGNVFVIPKVFSGSYIPSGWSNDDIQHCYAAPASSMTLNSNCVIFKLVNIGNKETQVKTISNSSNISFDNTVISAPLSERKNCHFSYAMNDDNHIKLSGCVKQQQEFYFKMAIKNPALKTLDTVADFLKELNIHVSGKVEINYNDVANLDILATKKSQKITKPYSSHVGAFK